MERLLTVDDVADPLQMPPRFVGQQIRLDHLECVIVGTEIRIEPSSYRQYLEHRKTLTPLVGQQRLEAVGQARMSLRLSVIAG